LGLFTKVVEKFTPDLLKAKALPALAP